MSGVHFMAEEIVVKHEPETQDEPENLSTCIDQAEKIVFHEARVKCGDVIIGCQGNFTLICSLCRDEFKTFDSFGLHIKVRHMGVKSELEMPVGHRITEPLIECDDTLAPRSSSRKIAMINYCEDKIPTRVQLEPVAEASKPAFGNSLQRSQHGENAVVKLGEELGESSDECPPEDEAGSKEKHLEEKEEYFCIHCGRTYICKKRFIAHSKKEHNYNPAKEAGDEENSEEPLAEPTRMVCKYCDKSFDDQNDFKNHMSTHTGPNRFVCPFCPKLFHCRSNRNFHVNTHTGERPFKCTQCSKAFSDKRDLNKHIRIHVGKQGKELGEGSDECTPEDEAGSKEKPLEEKEEYFCIHCGRTYICKKRFIAHSKKEHNYNPAKEAGDEKNSEEPLAEPARMVCKYCDKSFDDQIDFKNHMSTHIGPNRFVCPFCPKLFRCRINRNSHINTHTGERPFKCTHCSKAFSDEGNLQTHIRMHLGIMKYSCDYCDRRFVQSTGKQLHERTHTGERSYQCEECGRRFIAHVQLMEHIKRHKNIKNYKCEVCSKAFYNLTRLKDHIRTHTGERPFRCDICSQAFSRLKSLRAHQQLHSNEKKYVCHICGKAFAQYAGLYSHKKSHGAKEIL